MDFIRNPVAIPAAAMSHRGLVSASWAVAASQSHHHGTGAHLIGYAALAALAVVAAAAIASAVSPRWRRGPLRVVGLTGAGLIAAYLVIRGIAEFWVVDYSDPASYRHAWGGPSLAGVFAVHSGPALLVLIAAAVWLWQRRASRSVRQDARTRTSANHADV